MNIRVNVKQLGARRDSLAGVLFPLARKPQTVGELIREAVQTCVAEFNERGTVAAPTPLSDARMAELAELGKIAFGLHYHDREADAEVAAAVALQAYEDGVFRIFVGDALCGAPGEPLDLREEESVTFIRLTMLTGGLW